METKHQISETTLDRSYHVCPICHKNYFIPSLDTWAYRDGKYIGKGSSHAKWFCSWHCLREYRKTHKKKADGLWARE